MLPRPDSSCQQNAAAPRVAPRIVRIYTLSLSASQETAVELVLAVEEDVVPPDRADMGQ